MFVWLADPRPRLADERPHHRRQPDELGQFDLGLAGPFLPSTGEWYRLVTAGFLHFGIIHLAFNMLLLFQLGQLLEPAIGRVRFGLLYFAALLGGSAGALLLQPNALHGGASGAVFGLMGAAFVGMRNRGVNPFSTGHRRDAADQPVHHVHASRASRSAATSAASSAAPLAGWVVLAPAYRRVPERGPPTPRRSP